ncbi:MAG: trypsin-like peptidase domain-containing protein [Beijerinckiaceae bacterium]
MHNAILRSALIGAGALAFSAAAIAQESRQPMKSETEVVAAGMPSFVNIYQRKVVSTEKRADGTTTASVPHVEDDVGSGFIVSPDGLIVTNRHVIEGAYSIYVALSDGSRVPATLVGKSLNFDIALIKVDVGRPLPVAKIGDSSKLKVGDRVVAIGNPLGFSSSASTGIISQFHRDVGLSNYDNLIQTDATINQGNSGGPLYNMYGEVIGVNEAIYTRNKGGSIGIGFSIPVNEAKFLLENVKKNNGKPHIGSLGAGVQTVNPAMATALGRDKPGGAIISTVLPDGSAARAGLKVGDVILKLDGKQVFDVSSLNRLVSTLVDKTVQADILRDGKVTTLPVAIQPMSAELWATQLEPTPKMESLADFGITLASGPSDNGPVVAGIVESSIAQSAGLRAGDVIQKVQGKDVKSSDDILKVLGEMRAAGQKTAMVLVGGPNGQRWAAISVSQ